MKVHDSTSYQCYLKCTRVKQRLHEIYILRSCGIDSTYEEKELWGDVDSLMNVLAAMDKGESKQ